MNNDLATIPASDLRVVPQCALFGTCGGCSYQNFSYEDQLQLKRSLVVKALSEFQPDVELTVRPTLASPKPYGYRHMIALTVKRKQGKLRMGFIGHDRRSFLPVESCPITDERINRFLPTALQKLEDLPPERKFNTSQVVLRVGTEGDVVTSIRTDRGKNLECHVSGKIFSFSMSSFFQNNFSILETFVNTIQKFLKLDAPSLRANAGWLSGRQPLGIPVPDGRSGEVSEAISDGIASSALRPPCNDVCRGTLFDLYSGVGLIGILLADYYEKVIGLEEGYEAVKFAQENAFKNNITNISFLEGKVENLLTELTQKSKNPLHVVVDPPRIGLKPEVIECLTNLSIERLVYVSCSLEALKRDLEILTQRYKIQEVQPLDFFPQTKHVETLVLLTPRN